MDTSAADESVVTDSLGRSTGPLRQHSLEEKVPIVTASNACSVYTPSSRKESRQRPAGIFRPNCTSSFRTATDRGCG